MNQTGEESQAGTLLYMTPEVLSGVDLKASTAQDIWAIGILTYQLLVGKVPFDSEVNNLKAIKNDIITKPV